MKFSIRVPPCRPVPEVVSVICRAEQRGFDTVAVPYSPAIFRDTFSVLVSSAVQTRNVILGVAVTNIVSQQPPELASSARTVAELAPGRFRLGLGRGDSAITLTGHRRSTTTQLRDGIQLIRDLAAGNEVEVGAGRVRLRDPCPFPIFIGAEGSRNLSLAGEVADGFIESGLGSVADKHSVVAEAARAAGRDRPPWHVSIMTVRVTDNVEREALQLKPGVVWHVQKLGAAQFEEAGYSVSVPSGHIALPDGTDLGHPGDHNMAVRVASQWVSDELAIWFARNICLFGTADELADLICERVAACRAAGADEILFTDGQSFVLPTALIDFLGDSVIPRLRAAH